MKYESYTAKDWLNVKNHLIEEQEAVLSEAHAAFEFMQSGYMEYDKYSELREKLYADKDESGELYEACELMVQAKRPNCGPFGQHKPEITKEQEDLADRAAYWYETGAKSI